MKRENNDDGPHVDKRSRRNDDQIRILIPSNVSRHSAVPKLWSHLSIYISISDCWCCHWKRGTAYSKNAHSGKIFL